MPEVIRIDDPADPRVEGYRHIRERDLVGRRGMFVAEGEVVLRTLVLRSRHAPRSVLVAEKRIEGLRPLLERLPDGVPVYAAGQAVLDAVAGFHLHRGILALGRRAPELDAEALLRGIEGPAVLVALMGIGNHDNVGAVFRNAAAFGANAVLLDPTCCDPLYRKAIRVSVGAALTLPFARIPAGAEGAALMAGCGFEVLALSPSGAERLADLEPPRRAAVLLGAEGPGLPAEVLERVRTVSIPMAGDFDSLNVATAGAVALHHLVFRR